METAKKINAETVATTECIFNNELVDMIIEEEKYMEEHPNEWITAEESIARLRKIINN